MGLTMSPPGTGRVMVSAAVLGISVTPDPPRTRPEEAQRGGAAADRSPFRLGRVTAVSPATVSEAVQARP